MKLDERLMFPRLAPQDRDDLFDQVGSALLELGYVKDSWREALVAREVSFPTGLEVAAGGVAIPHTDAGHAAGDTVAVATLTHPVTFAPMGDPDGELIPVTTVLFLVLTDGPAHMEALSNVVKAIQDVEFMSALHDATTPNQVAAIVGDHLGLTTHDTK